MLEAVCVARLMTWDFESNPEPVKAFSCKTLNNFYKQIPCSFTTPYFLCCLVNTKRSPWLGTGNDTDQRDISDRPGVHVYEYTPIYTHTSDRIQTGQYPQTTDRNTGTEVEYSDLGLLFVKLTQWEVSVFMAQRGCIFMPTLRLSLMH